MAGGTAHTERTVTAGIGHGTRAARCIDDWLRGKVRGPADRPALAGFDQLTLRDASAHTQLIVVGRCRHGAPESASHGTITNVLLHRAGCPVAVVP